MKRHAIHKRRWAISRWQLLILLVAAVMGGSFFVFVLWPRQEELAVLGSAVARERHQVNCNVMVNQEGMFLTARIPGLRQAAAQLDQWLPTEPALAEFLQAVAQEVAAEPQVTREVERAELRPCGDVQAVPLRLRLTGPFDAVQRCIARIEGLDRLCHVRSLRLTRVAPDGNVCAETEWLVYYLPAGSPVAAAAQTSEPGSEKGRG